MNRLHKILCAAIFIFSLCKNHYSPVVTLQHGINDAVYVYTGDIEPSSFMKYGDVYNHLLKYYNNKDYFNDNFLLITSYTFGNINVKNIYSDISYSKDVVKIKVNYESKSVLIQPAEVTHTTIWEVKGKYNGQKIEYYTPSNELYILKDDIVYKDYADGFHVWEYVGRDTEVNIPDYIEGFYVTAIESNFHVFQSNTSNLIVKIPESVWKLDDIAFANKAYTEIKVDENNSYFSDVDGILFNKDKTKLVSYPSGLTSEKYVISDTTTSMNRFAFYMNDYIKEITIPEDFDMTNGIVANDNVILRVVKGSAAEKYAIENNICYVYY